MYHLCEFVGQLLVEHPESCEKALAIYEESKALPIEEQAQGVTQFLTSMIGIPRRHIQQ